LSYKLQDRAWKVGGCPSCGRRISGSAKLVLLRLAWHANDRGPARAFPKVPTLAAATGLSDRTVQRALRELESPAHVRGCDLRGRFRLIVEVPWERGKVRPPTIPNEYRLELEAMVDAQPLLPELPTGPARAVGSDRLDAAERDRDRALDELRWDARRGDTAAQEKIAALGLEENVGALQELLNRAKEGEAWAVDGWRATGRKWPPGERAAG